MNNPNKPILCLGFDGVLHGYQSGWKGAREIPDPPVPGALEFLVKALDHFDVHIHSSRSGQWGGRRAMKEWLRQQLCNLAPGADMPKEGAPEWWLDKIAETAFADPWFVEVAYAAELIVRRIKWPLFKPPALVTIDDRALTFTGIFPGIAELRGFQPWNRGLPYPKTPSWDLFVPAKGWRMRMLDDGSVMHERIPVRAEYEPELDL